MMPIKLLTIWLTYNKKHFHYIRVTNTFRTFLSRFSLYFLTLLFHFTPSILHYFSLYLLLFSLTNFSPYISISSPYFLISLPPLQTLLFSTFLALTGTKVKRVMGKRRLRCPQPLKEVIFIFTHHFLTLNLSLFFYMFSLYFFLLLRLHSTSISPLSTFSPTTFSLYFFSLSPSISLLLHSLSSVTIRLSIDLLYFLLLLCLSISLCYFSL